MYITATRYHDICAGHRVYGHEGKCAHFHGHNYRIYFTISGLQDDLGRVLDFSVIKEKLCNWLEQNWDHKFLLWENDPAIESFKKIDAEGLVVVPFNPTAENMAKYLVEQVGINELSDTNAELISVVVEETRKCSASYTK